MELLEVTLIHLKKAIKLLALDVPEYVYHVSPYANEILSSGFEIKPARQTFGGHGTYISVTTLENARKYAADLRLVVGFINLELTWEELETELKKLGLDGAFEASLQNRMFNELVGIPFRYTEDVQEEEISSWKNYLPKTVNPEKSVHDPNFYSWIKTLAFDQLDFDNNQLDMDSELYRRWQVLTGLWAYSPYENQFTLLMSSGFPYHLTDKDMTDVQIIEIKASPVEAISEFSYVGVPKDPKGKFTYNPSEKEWRFYDPTDLKPVRIVE